MFARHWFRLLALVLYVAGVVVVLQQCSHQFNPPPPPTPRERPAPVPDVISRQQRERAEKRAAHEEELQRRKAALDALEAELKTLREVDLPSAMAELAREALRYQNKISDLARLELAARWEREEPVKKARDRAYRLVLEYQTLDQTAQQERDGPTLYPDEAVALLTSKLSQFRGGGEGIAAFAAAVPAFAGQVPEKMLLECIDAITVAVLPADAFDPCRNPLACPKETAPQTKAAPPTPKEKLVSLRVVSWAQARDLYLKYEPDSRKPISRRLIPGEVLKATGRRSEQFVANGAPLTWIEVQVQGNEGRWALEKVFEKADDASAFDPWSSGYQPGPPLYRRSRKPDVFYGWFGK